MNADPEFRCDSCGEWYSWHELAETIEEYLCEDCASGMTDSELDDTGDDWDDDDGWLDTT